ncbi:phosphatase PAP2 family protein [Mycobacterium sp. IDR2000157661]|uniref:phosphatase PAP2 family protein n=1 Tax=Mycobacterium sp. IDR2000157661 TaxID=2867005 RepID=UPI001EEA77AF|nr:phosphatase PAP2 family protein [Mycobacterium sp. IDR2000157661]ULE34401.1 phosphatase PAP2 family protein [Mycobacterium sp. IDR2000157661]
MAPHKRWLTASAVSAVAVYAILWTGLALQWDWLSTLDSAALQMSYERGESRPDWVQAWDVFCTVLGPGALRLFTIVLIVVALVRRKARIAMFLLVSVVLAGLVTEAAKAAADRPRPATAFVSALGTAFPSGHALGVLVAVLALLTVGLPTVRPSLRGWLVALGAAVVVLIGVGRVVLNVHHPSDVLAGWALGYAYFVLCLLTVPPLTRLREADETPAAPGIAP